MWVGILIKLLTIDEGQIIFDGKDVTQLNAQGAKDFRQKIQMVFQDPYGSLDPRFTVRRIILESMTFDKETSKRVVRDGGEYGKRKTRV